MKYKHTHNTQKGAAMMITVLFFVCISITILIGVVNPVIRESRIAGMTHASKSAYFLAESGVEDVLYRIRNNKNISSSETLSLGGVNATTTISSLGSNQKQIDSLGDKDGIQRKVSLRAGTTVGVSFNYGILAGQGGVDLSGGGTVNGNIYAHGPITGDTSAVITGSAVSADSPPLFADQTNGVGTPAQSQSFGTSTTIQDIAQSFRVSTSLSPLNTISLYIKKTGSVSSATVKIVADANGVPDTNVIASGTLEASSVTTSYDWVDVVLDTHPTLTANTTYWIVVDGSTSSSKYYTIGGSSGGYSNGIGMIGQFGGTWNTTSFSDFDYYFRVSLGGVSGGIYGSSRNQLHIGTISGDAEASTVEYVDVTGTLYCQSGAGNNKSCTTSNSNPIYQSLPVSDKESATWKSDAEYGGVIQGNYSVGASGATLGPKKINGNLTVQGGGVLTLTGALWVTGNITLSGGGSIVLSSAYGTDDGVIVTDGTVSITGGAFVTGSGITGSYIMILSTSNSTNAVQVSGGAGAVIVYAPYGTVTLSGGASLKEVTGYKISIGGGSSVTYESGLADSQFSSGPSGTWGIDLWKEAE